MEDSLPRNNKANEAGNFSAKKKKVRRRRWNYGA
jgi:hypothetical protein